MKRITLLLIILLSLNVSHSQIVEINGTVLLENQTDHEDINIKFERTIPTSLIYNIQSDILGNYFQEIEAGIYNISFSKEGYIPDTLIDQLLYSNTLIDTITLGEVGLSGALTGWISKDVYKVGGDIFVPYGSTLELEAGVEFQFYKNVKFEIFGELIVNGNKFDRIKFTKFGSEYWNGVKIVNNSQVHEFNYCDIEYSKDCGLFLDNSDAEISNCVIQNNRISTNGNFYVHAGGITSIQSNVTIRNSIIAHNELYEGGYFGEAASGFASREGNIYIIASIFHHNIDVAYSGSGAILSDYSNLHIDNSLFFENYGHWGGAILHHSDNAIITNCTFTQNSSHRGGAIYTSISDPLIYNTIMFDNIADFGNELHNGCSSNGGSNPTFQYCNFGVVDPGDFYFEVDNPVCPSEIPYFLENVTVNYNGHDCDAYYNIQESVDFVDPDNHNYELAENSPCIDAGNNSFVNYYYDLAGKHRIYSTAGDSIVDIGAYEYGSDTIYTSADNLKIAYDEILYVYPNPCNGEISIEAKNIELFRASILNLSGQILMSLVPNSSLFKIDISNLQKGLYLLKIDSSKGIKVKKVILE